MSTIVLTSVSGAPGVTTTAIGLGRVWPQSSLGLSARPMSFQLRASRWSG